MILDLFLFLIWVILGILHALLSLIPISLPAAISDSVFYFAGFLQYLNGYIDMKGVFTAFGFLLDFMTAWFTFKGIMFLYHLAFARKVPDKQALPVQQK